MIHNSRIGAARKHAKADGAFTISKAIKILTPLEKKKIEKDPDTHSQSLSLAPMISQLMLSEASSDGELDQTGQAWPEDMQNVCSAAHLSHTWTRLGKRPQGTL